MAKKTESDKKVPLLVEDDSWSAPKAKDPFYTPESGSSTVKRLFDKVRNG